MYVKYDASISHGSKVLAKVKVDNRRTNRRTGQKRYAPNHLIQGIKMQRTKVVENNPKVTNILLLLQ